MSTILGTRFPKTFKGRPPGMSEEDNEIWLAWAPTILNKVQWMYFNVRLGEGIKAPPTNNPAIDKMWTEITQKRADAILDMGNEIWIVELRDAAALSAIGRLLGYKKLWNDDPALPGRLILVLVTNQIDRDVEATAIDTGINYIVINIPGRTQPEEGE